MRIPTYRSDVRVSNAAPGKRFSVRQDASPFIRAELEKGKVVEAAAEAAGAFAVQRQKIIVEQQYNDAALRIEEEMRNATYELSQDGDFANVLDGENKWQQRMDAIKNEVFDTVESPATRKKLEFEFEQNELQQRFSLQSHIDKKIIASEAASLARRAENTVGYLSEPGRTIDQYLTTMQQLLSAYEPGLKNQRFNPQAVDKQTKTIMADVAANVVDSYVGRTPARALEMLIALEQQIDIKSGKKIPQDQLAVLDAGGQYALFTLQNLGFDTASGILAQSLEQAKKFSKLAEEEQKRREDAMAFVIDNVKNRYQYYVNAFNPAKKVTPDDLTEVEKSIPGLEDYVTKNESVTNADIISRMKDYLYDINAVDNVTQNMFNADELSNTVPFAEVTSPGVFDELTELRITGELTFADLRREKSFISRVDYTTFANGLLAAQRLAESDSRIDLQDREIDEAKARTQVLRVAASGYQYDKDSTNDSAFAKRSKAAYSKVQNVIDTAILNAMKNDKNLTVNELSVILNQAMKDNEQLYFDSIAEAYDEFLSDDRSVAVMEELGYSFNLIGSATMVDDFRAWSTTAGLQEHQNLVASRVQRRLAEFVRSGAFQ